MTSLVSPEYKFLKFCESMLGKDPIQMMDAASAEITYALRIHRERTKDRDFRKASRGRAYCDSLKQFISLFIGSVPAKPSQEFLDAVKPLALDLLQRFDIVGFRELLSYRREAIPSMDLSEVIDFVTIVISKDQVEAGDISVPLGVLSRLVESPKTARCYAERVAIAFHGYDDVPTELFEIPEVRSFVVKLDESFPYWLFCLSKHHLGLQCVLLCFLPLFLTDEARSDVFPAHIRNLLTSRWFPAMNYICGYAGFSEQEVYALTDRVLTYVNHGRLPLELNGN